METQRLETPVGWDIYSRV